MSDFKAHASDWMRKAEETGAPVVVTQNGRPAGVLLSPEAFDELTERARFIASIDEGQRDADVGHVHSHGSVVERMKKRFGRK